ncbi:aminomethyl-transferring glycine dehydrogenase subunit GcvPA [Leucobacter zeae]|nr:aminomethyl-transferring glycine dehydrogenase subunit GcvPA [Leucobacter zeae]
MPTTPHPYLPNSVPAVRQEMLDTIGVGSIDDLYETIPEHLRMPEGLRLPEALESEARLVAHMRGVLGQNEPALAARSFLGYGCYQHYVPATCGEINGRAEFLTAYAGESTEDHGKWQALFEYSSLMAELLDMDVVSIPTYDGYQAAATALRMGLRLTGRSEVVVSTAMQAGKLAKIRTYLPDDVAVRLVDVDEATGALDAARVAELIGDGTAAVLIESPNVFGVVETAAEDIARAAHARGAVMIAATDPVSLGYLDPPASWGADIVCGDIQALGIGMHFGGGHGGFIATHDEPEFVFEFPSRLFGLTPTSDPGEIGFTDVAYERTSLARREEGNEWVGTAASLWAITAGVYLSLMGPQGMRELGVAVAGLTRYAKDRIGALPGFEVPHSASANWREFVVRHDSLGASEIRDRMLGRGFHAGVDLGRFFPDRGDQLLLSVTEQHSQADIDALVRELGEIA